MMHKIIVKIKIILLKQIKRQVQAHSKKDSKKINKHYLE